MNKFTDGPAKRKPDEPVVLNIKGMDRETRIRIRAHAAANDLRIVDYITRLDDLYLRLMWSTKPEARRWVRASGLQPSNRHGEPRDD